LMDLGDVQGAQDAIGEALSQVAKLRHEQGDTLYSRAILALVHKREGLILGEDGGVNLNRPQEAAAALQEGFDLLEQSARSEPKDYHSRHALAEVGLYLAHILRHSNPTQAMEVYDHTLMRVREVPKDVAKHREEASLLAGSSYAARWIHRGSDARDRIDEAFRLLREIKDYPVETIKPGSEADTTLRALADHYAETGQTNEALNSYQELRRKIMASNPDPQNDLVNAALISHLDTSLASLLRRVGRTAEAVTLEENRLNLWRHWNRKLPSNPFVLRQIAAKPAG
jgi:tetratricopeptide (TPR) repeat protein